MSERAAAGMPTSWSDEIHDVVLGRDAAISDALDQAILLTPLQGRRPRWWALAGVLQWIFAAVALIGLVWLIALAGFASVQIHLEAPTLGSWLPIPLLLLMTGLVAGLGLALLARALSSRGARRARKQAQARLDKAIEGVARERIVQPVADLVRRHDECAHELAHAAA